MLGKLWVFEHVLDFQGLHADRLAFVNQSSRQFMLEVIACVRRPFMRLGNKHTRLVAVPRTVSSTDANLPYEEKIPSGENCFRLIACGLQKSRPEPYI